MVGNMYGNLHSLNLWYIVTKIIACDLKVCLKKLEYNREDQKLISHSYDGTYILNLVSNQFKPWVSYMQVSVSNVPYIFDCT